MVKDCCCTDTYLLSIKRFVFCMFLFFLDFLLQQNVTKLLFHFIRDYKKEFLILQSKAAYLFCVI